jgi:hypothetical protein
VTELLFWAILSADPDMRDRQWPEEFIACSLAAVCNGSGEFPLAEYAGITEYLPRLGVRWSSESRHAGQPNSALDPRFGVRGAIRNPSERHAHPQSPVGYCRCCPPSPKFPHDTPLP